MEAHLIVPFVEGFHWVFVVENYGRGLALAPSLTNVGELAVK